MLTGLASNLHTKWGQRRPHMLVTLSKWPSRRRPNKTGSRTAPAPFLNDKQWLMIADLFPVPPKNPQGGRPRVASRPCLEGILWILQSGARWKDLPERYPSPATCWRRFQAWTRSGIWVEAWKRVLGRLDQFQRLNWEEALADGTFSSAKKGVWTLATPRREREPRSC